jgi:hypothetical protein
MNGYLMMNIKQRTTLIIATTTWFISVSTSTLIGAPAQAAIPDFTQGGKTDGSHDWTLGPTGARGWMYAWKHTADARQILITEVAKDSPADGILEIDDVILGINHKTFSKDARIQFGRAVTRAEQEASGGILKLTRWRSGQIEDVAVKIPVMGSYSATAPFDCQKSTKIFERGCEWMAKRGLERVSIPNSINALALLASGKQAYQSLLSNYAKMVADYQVGPFATWHYGYAIMFLAEYVLATGDHSVMPGLERLALESAHGQSLVGTWGHRFALPDGRVGGYGCMNSPGIPLTISMVLARMAGVKHSDLDLAITRSARFLRWYVNKGAIPYGDHHPWPGHEDNGKCSMAAVLFDLLDDREAATFFAKMSVAAYNERERGHTGNFFNMLWAMPAVARCGPLATGGYWREQAWYYDLAREWDGSFRYQGSPVGEEEHNKYTHWDNTGTYLLAFAVPLKSLYVTGKKTSIVPALDPSEVDKVIAAGRDYFSTRTVHSNREMERYRYEHRSHEALLSGLSSWSPAVRKRSAQELGRRDGDFMPTLTKLLASSDRNSRYGAVEAFGNINPKAHGPARVSTLTELLKADDLWLRILAAEALAGIGGSAKLSIPNMLERFAIRDPQNDPRGMEHRYLSFALFNRRGGLIGRSLEGVDRELLLQAVRNGLQNQDGRARGSLATVYQNLTFDEIKPLLPAILQAIAEKAPSGIMFASEIRMSGLELFAKHRVSEGIELLVDYASNQKAHGSEKRIVKVMEMLKSYGTHAQRILPQLEAGAIHFDQGEKNYPRHLSRGKAKLVRETIKAIEASTDEPELISINR